MTPAAWPIDPGLLARFRSAGQLITWRPAKAPRSGTPGRPRVRIAHLNDEESRVEELQKKTGRTLVVDSGPVGALVVLLEVDGRGPATVLIAHEGTSLASFPNGAIEARWGRSPKPTGKPLPVADLVNLARYALA